MKPKIQALTTTIRELRLLADDLERELKHQKKAVKLDVPYDSKWLIPIMNKSPELSDTWKFAWRKRYKISKEKNHG